jgi:hypothetical protein
VGVKAKGKKEKDERKQTKHNKKGKIKQ